MWYEAVVLFSIISAWNFKNEPPDSNNSRIGIMFVEATGQTSVADYHVGSLV